MGRYLYLLSFVYLSRRLVAQLSYNQNNDDHQCANFMQKQQPKTDIQTIRMLVKDGSPSEQLVNSRDTASDNNGRDAVVDLFIE